MNDIIEKFERCVQEIEDGIAKLKQDDDTELVVMIAESHMRKEGIKLVLATEATHETVAATVCQILDQYPEVERCVAMYLAMKMMKQVRKDNDLMEQEAPSNALN